MRLSPKGAGETVPKTGVKSVLTFVTRQGRRISGDRAALVHLIRFVTYGLEFNTHTAYIKHVSVLLIVDLALNRLKSVMDKGNLPVKLMSKRLATYLPDGIYEFLEDWANQEKRSISNLAAFLLEQSARERMEKLEKMKQMKQEESK